MKKASFLLPLCAGLVLGAGAAWTVQRARSSLFHVTSDEPGGASRASTTTAGNTASATPAAPALLLPPLLAGAEADAALEAYLALPLLPKDAPADEVQLRLDRLNGLLTLLPDSHFSRLLDALATREGDAEARLRRAAFDIWTEHDAQTAARWAFALVPGKAINAQARSRYVTQAALAWGRDDFTAAYAWTGALGDAPLRASLLPRFLGQLAATDPRQAAALAQNGDEAFVRAAQRAVFEAWATRDPAAALRELGPGLVEQRDRPWSVSQALTKWIVRDPAAALKWAAAQPVPDGETHRALLNNIGWNLTDQNPEAVRPFVDELMRGENVPNRERVLLDLFGPWARKDSASALAWLDTVPDGAQRSDLVGQALNYVETGRLDDFMALARRLPESSERDQKIADQLANWAKRDPEAALAWLAKHDEPELARAAGRVEGVMLASLAETDPAAAVARWAAMPADGNRLEIAVPVASAWAKTDSAAATRWLVEQLATAPNDPRTMNLSWQLRYVAAGWLARDPVGYYEWAQTFPEGPASRRTIQAMIDTPLYSRYGEPTSVEAPPRAAYAEKLAKIPDAAFRDSVLSAHLSAWLRSDVRSARAWIESSDTLSPELAARLLTQTDNAY